MLRVSAPSQKHLLLPSHPTPNGRLHLGHIAGPYLKIDVLRRALQRRGDQAVVIFGVDSFESYVLLQAHQLGIEPDEVNRRYVREIREDLAALDIEVAIFFDPLNSPWSTSYRDSIYQSIQSLQDRKAIEFQKENFLFCPASSRFIVGCWLQGNCPNCGKEAGGYGCEACGIHYRPEEVVNARSRLDEGPLETVSCNTMFLRVHNTTSLEQRIEAMLPNHFQQILRQYLKRSGAKLRISVPGTWGIPIEIKGETQPLTVFSGFAALGLLYSYGNEYARQFRTTNPFHPQSDVTITCSFGIDNTVSRILSCVGGAISSMNFRPPDSLLLNYFYRLEGAKFSTSRNHVIWASAIANISPGISDIVRFYLLETAPEESETDFNLDGFLATANELNDEWNPVINQALSRNMPAETSEPILQALENSLAIQEKCLAHNSFRSQRLPSVLRDWINLGHQVQPEGQYWWLKGFALLAWPVLPRLSSALWTHLGHSGTPTNQAFLQPSKIRNTPVQLFEPILRFDLASCTNIASG